MVNITDLMMQSELTTDAQRLAAMKVAGHWYGKDVALASAPQDPSYYGNRMLAKSTVRAPYTADYEIQVGAHSGRINNQTKIREVIVLVHDENNDTVKMWTYPHPSPIKIMMRLKQNWTVQVKPTHAKNKIQLIGR